jgi:hypothetical protein
MTPYDRSLADERIRLFDAPINPDVLQATQRGKTRHVIAIVD